MPDGARDLQSGSALEYPAAMGFRDFDTRLAAYCVIVEPRDGQEHVLLSMLRAGNTRWGSMWTLPGGGVEYDEGFEAAAIREVREETGYDARLTGMLGARTFTPRSRTSSRDPRPFKSAAVLFEAEVTGGELGTLEVDGSTEFAAWVPLADVMPQRDPGAVLRDHTSEGPYLSREGVRVMSTVGYALDLWARRH